jgi:hypothetical protein
MKHLQSCSGVNCLAHCPCDCHETATQTATERAIYQKGFGDGHKEAREYNKRLIQEEIWERHEFSKEFIKEHNMSEELVKDKIFY